MNIGIMIHIIDILISINRRFVTLLFIHISGLTRDRMVTLRRFPKMFDGREVRSTISIHPVEVLLDDRLEDEVYGIFNPLNFTLGLLFSSKYNLRNKYITPKSKHYYILAVLCVCYVGALGIFRWHVHKRHVDSLAQIYVTEVDRLIFYMSCIFYILYFLACSIIYVVTSIHSHKNVLLVIKINAIHRSINSNNSVRVCIKYIWVLAPTIICFNVAIIGSFTLPGNLLKVLMLSSDILYCNFDINFIYVTIVLILLEKYLKKWNNSILMMVDEQDDDKIQCDKVLDTYHNIFKAYDLSKMVSQVLVLFSTIFIFFRTVCFLGMQLLMYHADPLSEVFIYYSPNALAVKGLGWLIKDISLLVTHSVVCEKFYIAVEDSKSACIQRIADKNCSKNQQQLCKNVLQFNRTFSRMSACGLFYVDGTLPIRLVGLLSNYVIVLLQFAYL